MMARTGGGRKLLVGEVSTNWRMSGWGRGWNMKKKFYNFFYYTLKNIGLFQTGDK